MALSARFGFDSPIADISCDPGRSGRCAQSSAIAKKVRFLSRENMKITNKITEKIIEAAERAGCGEGLNDLSCNINTKFEMYKAMAEQSGQKFS